MMDTENSNNTVRIAKLACLIMLGSHWTATTGQADLVLVREGLTQAVIVVPTPRAQDSQARRIAQDHAASTLSGHLAQMSGARVPIVRESGLGDVRVTSGRIVCDLAEFRSRVFVLVGEGELSRQLGVTSEALAPGGVRIKALPNALVVLGHPRFSHPYADAGGVRRAVAILLESLGCRYLWPGETGKVVPATATVEIRALDITRNPPIGQRRIRSTGMSRRPAIGLQRVGMSMPEWREAWKKALHTVAAGFTTSPPICRGSPPRIDRSSSPGRATCSASSRSGSTRATTSFSTT